MFRYTMVSVISTAVSLASSASSTACPVWTEVPSTVFANVVATVPSYYLNRRWAWGKSGRSHVVKEVLPVLDLASLGIAASSSTPSQATHIGTAHTLDHVGPDAARPRSQPLRPSASCGSSSSSSSTGSSAIKLVERGAPRARRGARHDAGRDTGRGVSPGSS